MLFALEAARGLPAPHGRLPRDGGQVAARRRPLHRQDPGGRLRRRWRRRTGPFRPCRPIPGRTSTSAATRRPPWSGCWPPSTASKAPPRLGESSEFKYIRTLMPRGDRREDGFVYLSDPFIRRLVGPELKLTEGRRMVCYNNLRMIGHAAMLYRTQFGKQPKSLEELAEAGCLPPSFAHAKVGRRRQAARLPERRKVFALGRRHDRRLLASRPRPADGPLPGNPAGAGDRAGGRRV